MFDQIISVFFPERCAGCRRSGTALCSSCYKTIPAAAAIIEPANCVALFNYEHPLVQQAVWELKYHRKSALAKSLAVRGAPIVMEHIDSLLQSAVPVPLIVVPIPQHRSKTNSRGFNQSKVIAEWMKAALPTATLQLLLTKTRATDPQAHTHTRKERQQNLRHSMKAVGMIDRRALYIIIDDVITTGSTVTEAGRALRAAGARNICAVALAHGYARKW
ncbi:MAG: phosphoribosyltransferase [Candidatus Nomurabacteria bacterium]|nr:phosphoribosyltransferase [Candidatus Nomurabacteria bacterium]